MNFINGLIPQNIDFLKYYIQHIKSVKNNDHEQDQDALIKWAYILWVIDYLKLKPKRILDLGAGYSHLPAILADYPFVEEVVAIDKNKFCRLCKEHPKVTCKLVDVFSYFPELESQSFDLIYDACAITHFRSIHKAKDINIKKIKHEINLKHVGLFHTIKHINRLLKPDTFCISSSDILLEKMDLETNTDLLIFKIFIKHFKLNGFTIPLKLSLNDPFIYTVYRKAINQTISLNIAGLIFKK